MSALKQKKPSKIIFERLFLVDSLGLEPRITEPKSAVLPITP